ncbi:MAG TPA: hypothetical protein VMC41_01490 [Candidatus Nanoarchaeia archaeon]|nr:hypothetical protein [Candidatus Nanoarchaeia archaeon]
MAQKKIVKKMMKTGGNVPVVASLIVLIAFIVGLLFGSLVVAKSFSGGKVFLANPMTGSFADGYNAAKQKLAASGILPPRQTGVLSGQITAINGQQITFSAPLANPLDNESLKIRIAVVTDQTVINLSRQKSAEQIRADQASGQKALSDIQSQISALQGELSKCAPGAATAASNSDCAAISKNYADAILKQNQAIQQMDIFEKVDNASLADLKPGMQITVYAEKIAPAASQTSGAPGTSNFADISQLLKFNVSLIEAREISAPASAFLPRAATSTPVK